MTTLSSAKDRTPSSSLLINQIKIEFYFILFIGLFKIITSEASEVCLHFLQFRWSHFCFLVNKI